MKVVVDSNMTIYGVFQPPVEVELRGAKVTLRDLLHELTELCKSVEFITDNEVGNDIKTILINNKEYYAIDTKLNDGDKVMVIVEVAPIGGG